MTIETNHQVQGNPAGDNELKCRECGELLPPGRIPVEDYDWVCPVCQHIHINDTLQYIKELLSDNSRSSGKPA